MFLRVLPFYFSRNKVNNYNNSNYYYPGYNVKNNVEFFDLKDNKSMGVLTLDPFDIVSTDSKSIYSSYPVKNWNLGVYNAIATLEYAGKTTHASKSFTVGDIKMEIFGLNQTKYEKGKINKVPPKVTHCSASA